MHDMQKIQVEMELPDNLKELNLKLLAIKRYLMRQEVFVVIYKGQTIESNLIYLHAKMMEFPKNNN